MNLQTTKKIQEEVRQIKKDLLDIKIKQKTQQQVKTHLFKKKKHRLAQLLTLKSQINHSQNY